MQFLIQFKTVFGLIKLMNYNQLSFYRADPYHKQDYLPDRAWFNRQAKSYPSEMPSGKDFLSGIGRRHFHHKFNHSEIEDQNVLKSPERFPFQNRIAMDKTYMRSLNTIDIEGASSNTRVNQSIKNKYKARDQRTRYNQSLEIAEKTEEQKRREVAEQYFKTIRDRQKFRVHSLNEKKNDSRVSSSQKSQESPFSSYKQDPNSPYQGSLNNSKSNIKAHNNQPQKNQNLIHQNNLGFNSNNQRDSLNKGSEELHMKNIYKLQDGSHFDQSKKGRPASFYQNQFNTERWRKNEQYQKILEYEELNRRMMKRPSQMRQNPNSLSFSLAGQNIVGN